MTTILAMLDTASYTFVVMSSAPQAPFGDTPPLSLTVLMGITCCAVGLVVGVLVLGFILSRTKNKGPEETKDPQAPLK